FLPTDKKSLTSIYALLLKNVSYCPNSISFAFCMQFFAPIHFLLIELARVTFIFERSMMPANNALIGFFVKLQCLLDASIHNVFYKKICHMKYIYTQLFIILISLLCCVTLPMEHAVDENHFAKFPIDVLRTILTRTHQYPLEKFINARQLGYTCKQW